MTDRKGFEVEKTQRERSERPSSRGSNPVTPVIVLSGSEADGGPCGIRIRPRFCERSEQVLGRGSNPITTVRETRTPVSSVVTDRTHPAKARRVRSSRDDQCVGSIETVRYTSQSPQSTCRVLLKAEVERVDPGWRTRATGHSRSSSRRTVSVESSTTVNWPDPHSQPVRFPIG